MTDVKGRSPRDPNPWYRGSKRYGDLGRHAPPGDELENTRDHERIWHELAKVPFGQGVVRGSWVEPTLLNGWVNAGAPFDDIAYRLDGDDVLCFKGHIIGGDSGSVAFVLGPGYVPTKDLSTITDIVTPGSPQAAEIYIDASTGEVIVSDVTFGPPGTPGSTGPPGPTGPTGPPGTNGTNGTNGVGVPAGGSTGQALVKQSATNFDTIWATISGGGGAGLSRAITQTAHGLAVGNVVRFDGTTYVKAQANSVANAEVVGIVSAVADANNFTLASGGYITGLAGLTPGAVYFLSPTTAGAMTVTEPTAVGQVSKPLLIAEGATVGYFFNWRGELLATSSGGGGGGGGLLGYLCYEEQQAANVNGGTSVTGSWGTRVLNTEVYDTNNDGALSSNRITLTAGTYQVRAYSEFTQSARTQIRLYNVTDSVELVRGMTSFANVANDVALVPVLEGRFTVGASKALELQYQVESGRITYGLGYGVAWGTNVFSRVILERIS